MASYLDRIVGATRARVEAERRRRPLPAVEREAAGAPPARDFLGAVKADGISLVAEVKRRSPSAGPIRPEADPALVAAAYERGGAAALSVLTEPDFFGGSLDDLARARAATALPTLRKDFVIDPYQVVEARAAGADAVLLIIAGIADPGLYRDLAAAAGAVGLAALVEVHDEREAEVALEAGSSLIGVNQRNLATFTVDRTLAARLRGLIPAGVAVVAESGIASREEVEALEAAGVDAVLVGEALMRAGDPGRAAAALLGRGPAGARKGRR